MRSNYPPASLLKHLLPAAGIVVGLLGLELVFGGADDIQGTLIAAAILAVPFAVVGLIAWRRGDSERFD